MFEKEGQDIVEWTPMKLGVLKREYEKAKAQGADEFTLPSSVTTSSGKPVTFLTRYAKYVIEYLEDVQGMRAI